MFAHVGELFGCGVLVCSTTYVCVCVFIASVSSIGSKVAVPALHMWPASAVHGGARGGTIFVLLQSNVDFTFMQARLDMNFKLGSLRARLEFASRSCSLGSRPPQFHAVFVSTLRRVRFDALGFQFVLT